MQYRNAAVSWGAFLPVKKPLAAARGRNEMDRVQRSGENYANPKTCFFHVLFKNVSGRILVGLRWWNEIDEQGESVWKFECLDQESLALMNKKDSWLFWWTLYLAAVSWIFLGVFSLIRFQADYLLVVGVCLSLSIANIVGFTKCRKDAKKQIQQFATKTIASQFASSLQSAFSVV
ncbi:hypothetical protein MUK42_15724 [Musa troglodytarum]|uniref:Golgi apparatus membrane protein TVP23 n=1 Tax=Musa troglodytarum TaxID=320322 RepID=A0A9E7H5P4_9LILI|nr:hypothetical protein MUK42_15724 [Musa troglodytarum]